MGGQPFTVALNIMNGRSSITKSAIVAPLLVPLLVFFYLGFGPVSAGIVHAGEGLVFGVVLLISAVLGYGLFFITVFPAYWLQRNAPHLFRVARNSGIIGTVVCGPLSVYVLRLAEAKLTLVDKAAIFIIMGIIPFAMGVLFLALARKFENETSSEI